MHNVLHFPPTTVVDIPVSKRKFLSYDSSLREALKREFESIVWLYKLSAATLNVYEGERVSEIDVFYCVMKEEEYSLKTFRAIDALFPHQTLFVIAHGGRHDLLMRHKEKTLVNGEEKWTLGESELRRDVPMDAGALRIQGLSMDTVYSGFLSQISGLAVSSEAEYKEQAVLRGQIEGLRKQAAALQRRITAERQLSRKMELNAGLRQLRREITSLTDKLNMRTHE